MGKLYDSNEPPLEDLYPGQAEDWYREAEERLKDYLELANKIWERRQRDKDSQQS